MDYDNINNEFEEIGKDYHIKVYYNTNKYGVVCNFKFNFDGNAFFDKGILTEYLKKIEKSQEKYLPTNYSKIENENKWVHTHLKFFMEMQNPINFDHYLEEINGPLKEESEYSLDNLIDVRLKKRNYENEIDQYLEDQLDIDFEKFEAEQIPIIESYLEKKEQYVNELNDLLNKDQLEDFYKLGKEYNAFLETDFVQEEKGTHLERTLDLLVIKSDQRELLKLIENDDLENIRSRHYEALPDNLVHKLKDYIELEGTRPELLNLIYGAIGKNFLKILYEYRDVNDKWHS